jgi:hypothetical protein
MSKLLLSYSHINISPKLTGLIHVALRIGQSCFLIHFVLVDVFDLKYFVYKIAATGSNKRLEVISHETKAVTMENH